ncbi:MAG: 30S ribosomal protein S1 [Phycisphaerales bacterium]|nr:30S ribosomal protein S1 [Phycisphaerales bacterium]
MVDYNLISDIDIDSSVSDNMVREALGDISSVLESGAISQFKPGAVLPGRVVSISGDFVIIDVGLKSEGQVPIAEFEDAGGVSVGDTVDVMIEGHEDAEGSLVLSKRKADRIRGWSQLLLTRKEGDVVEGKVLRKIKGGLLVDIGVPVFLPASQVDVRRPGDVGDFLGRTIRASILKIDEERRNIVISRRKLIEEERDAAKKDLMAKVVEGAIVKGIVTNIADFGAFVDLGGVDGLLHITDMSWGRVNHPSEIVKSGQEIEVKILNIDREREKIALGLKQKESSPWEQIEKKYPVGARVRGTVVNLMSYGAFVRLEDGIEGLVHVSEMSWTRRVNHPSEVVAQAQEIDVVVLDFNKDKLEISLGMKQTEVNPWDLVSEKYPLGTVIEGKVRNLANYGAFIEIEPGIDGLLHVSDMSWTKKVAHPNEVVKKGDALKCVVIEVDQEKQRVGLGLKQLAEDPWVEAIPSAYRPGMIVKGKITKITNFGVFVELEDGLEGLLHISELADAKVENPQDVVKPNQEVDVKILRVDTEERKIALSLKRAQWGAAATPTPAASSATKHEDDAFLSPKRKAAPTRGGMDDHGALGTDKFTLPGT